MEETKKKVDEEEAIDEDEDLDLDDFDEEDETEDDEGRSSDDDGEDDDEEDVDDNQKVKEEKPEKPKQSREERARQAKMRREREAKERAKREKEIEQKAYLKGQLDSTKVNTFTNEPIEDEYDLKIFNLQRQIERDGGDPISDLPKKLAELERKEALARKKEEDAKKEADDFISKDIANFKEKYPDVNLRQLLEDPDFRDYSEGRLGVKGGKPLTDIYEAFNRFKAKYVKENEEDEKKPTPPSPNGGRKQEKTSYSNMTEEEKIKYLRKQGLIK